MELRFCVTRKRVAIVAAALASMALIAAPTGVAAAGGNAANAKKCQKGGWTSFVRSDGTAFTSEEECTSYAAQGGTLTPKSLGQLACEQVGGVYGPGSGSVVFTCNQYATSFDEWNAELGALSSACFQMLGNHTHGFIDPNTVPPTTTFTCFID